MTSDTPKTPTTFNKAFKNALLSIQLLADLLPGFSSLDLTLSILIVLSSLGSRLTMFAYGTMTILVLFPRPTIVDRVHADHSRTYISRQQTIDGKGATLALIVCPEHNDNILDTNHQRQGPNDQREGAEKIIIARFRGKG